ncbi:MULTISPECIES: MFS transporter [unclassified Rhodococcus (in: high G+C Gram-positive bacteria)]|uniref:MFS transporter n=1 Tax=unclassified Rhodococcus (in: high G+C Gram-positive bacteria) TaxID=192944 RepID=UPI0004956960|nr:MFS transporter [Rhodococcus sp. DK17]
MTVDQSSPAAQHSSGTRVPVSRRQAWTIVVLLFTFLLLNYADKAIVGLAGVEMMDDLDIDAGAFGLVQSAFFWLFAVGAILGGYFVGKVPARWLVGGVALLWTLSLVPMVWSTSFTVLIITRILLGFAEGPSAAMAFGITHTWFAPEKRALPTSIVGAGVAVGPVVAAPVITALITSFDWHAAFAVAAAAGALFVAAWLLLGRDGPEAVGHQQSSIALLPEHVPYRRLLTSGTVVGVAVLFFATFCTAATKISWLPLALRQGSGYDAKTAGWLVSLTYLASAVLMIAFGAVSRAMTKRGASVRTARGLLPCALVGIGGLSTSVWLVPDPGPLQTILLIVGAALVVGAQGVAWSLLSDVVPAKQRGTVIGTIVAFYSMGGIIAPLILGGFVTGASTPLAGYQSGFALLGGILVVAGVVGALLIRPERDVAAFAAADK